jgi:hypothetical protein
MTGYRADRAFTERFVPDVCRIVGPHMLVPSGLEVDRREATDLVVIVGRNLAIGVRIRRKGYAARFPYDFTIRAHRDSGARTELAKVTAGWMDWMFYAHAADDEKLARWLLVDMAVWRRELMRHGWRAMVRLGLAVERDNHDGTRFVACDVRRYPATLLVAASHPVSSGEPEPW